MAQFTTNTTVSFAALEQMGFKLLGELVAQMMAKVLKVMDEALFEGRDRARYESNGSRPRSVQTLFGELQYSRRVYRDRRSGELVALLDEALGLESRARMSPGLVQTAVIKVAEGPSYRGARDIVSGFYGHQVISHEAIRQKVLLVGQRIAAEERRALRDPKGDRKVGVLLVEVDGVYVPRQGSKGKRRELRLMVAHEGWRPRHPASDEYELTEPMRFSVDGGGMDFWEAASRALYTRYDLTDTLVVINGDRASWIRQGVKYFPRAIYQFDRFHLLRDMKQVLRDNPDDCLAAIDCIRADRPAKAFWILRKIARQPGDREEVRRLLADLKGNGRAMIDYRARLRAMGHDVRGYRGLGAAESNVSLYSKRLRHRGQSWGSGFMAMVRLFTRYFEGVLLNYVTDLARVRELVSENDLREGLGRVSMEVANSALLRLNGHVPALTMGRNASHGLSHFFKQVNQTLPAGLS
jgi:hypothetical protein